MSTAKQAQAEALTLPEMLRIMDVATALRQDRELVEEQLNFGELKTRLREKMIATARITGEEVSPEEVDAAIEGYYSKRFSYKEPPMSGPVAAAHVYVRRWSIAKWGGAALGSVFLVWWLFLSPTGPLTATGRTHRHAERLASEIARRREAISAVARDSSVAPELARLAAEAETFKKLDDLPKLKELSASLARLESRLNEEYTVSVLAAPGGRSAFTRYFPDDGGKKVSGYCLIVEAKTRDGTVLKRRVHNIETGKDKDVMRWAERVPKEVYERLEHDKKEDGVLNETTFAVKRRGEAEEQVTMPGADGKPLTRIGQITEW
jgi:hypothetical protein